MAINFTKAIEIVERPAASDPVLDFLRKEAPSIAELYEKDMTAGDVHVSSAGGDDDPKKKPKTFEEKIGDMADLKPAKVETEKRAAGADFNMTFKIVKSDPDKQCIFGWASVSEVGGKLVVDKQNDVILPEDLEKAAYNFVLYSRQQGDMHERVGTGRLIESMAFTKQKQEALGIDLGLQGWWVGFKVDDPELWAAHKRGERPEFSIGGRAERVEMAAAA